VGDLQGVEGDGVGGGAEADDGGAATAAGGGPGGSDGGAAADAFEGVVDAAATSQGADALG
jgi:hypothetical protein